MKKALVTGANGFVGSAVVRELLKNNVEVIALGRAENRGNIPAEAKFVPFELAESVKLPTIVTDRNIDVFYHFAWANANQETREDPYTQLENVKWSVDCLCAAEKMGCKRFVGVGSLMEDEAVAAAYEIDNRPGTACVYGAGKLMTHSIMMYMAQKMKIKVIWARITNAYGPGEVSPRFINTTIRKILKDEPLQFTSATQNYDFVYISDVARAFRMIGEEGKAPRSYLIGSNSPRPLREFILEMKNVLAPEKEFVFGTVPFTGVNTALSGLNCSMTEQDTGFRPEVTFEEGIKKTMEWQKDHSLT